MLSTKTGKNSKNKNKKNAAKTKSKKPMKVKAIKKTAPKLSAGDKIRKESKEYSFTSWSVQGEINPLLIEKTEGIHLWDSEGNKYIDLTSQLVLSNIGHGNQHVINAMKKQMDKVCFVSPNHTTEIKAKLAKKLAEITPGDLKKTFFTLGGADAVENAMKIAQLYTGKKKIFARYVAYHGGTFAASNVGGDVRRQGICENLPWVRNFHLSHTEGSPLYKGVSKDEGDQRSFELLAETIRFENPNTIAAIILEGYSGSSGIHNPGKKFWQLVRKFCTENNIILIADEVMSGFGRTGKWFGVNNYDVTPDIMVMAKGLTSGYAPLGAVIVNEKISDYFEDHSFNCGLTYSSHSVSLAAALANIEVYEKQKLVKNAETVGKYLEQELKKLQKRKPMISDIRGTGLHMVIELSDKKGNPISEWNKGFSDEMKQIIGKLRANGLIGLCRWNLIFITPPLIVTKKDIDDIIKKLEKALS